MGRRCWKFLPVGLVCITAALALDFTRPFPGDRDHPAIEYGVRPEHNAISELNAKLRDGKIRLAFDGTPGYLRSTLEALSVPVESQLVVFSKTSLQQRIISATNPRTIFFNDSVAVAWVRGEPFVEVAAEDSQQGVIFYTLDQRATDKPVFIRRDGCLQCHEDYATLGVPGMLVRSVFPAPDGTAMRPLGEFVSDHRSPFQERWGGWYVTGKSGGLRHLGNLTFTNSEDAGPVPKAVDLASLEGKFETSSYLSPYSDIVALMVFNHQMRMINLLTRAGWEVRFADHEGQSRNTALLRDAAQELADYMLYVDETPLPGPIQGTSGFAEKFSAVGPKDSRGRSFRQFDLERRLMRYPCSYLIYSQAFDALPRALKEAVYGRIWQILSGEEKAAKYARLSLADRQAIVEILRETKMDLPDYFQAVRL
ncbi:MAG TPA: hypothetical protein VGV35_09245 [Bryobacteraceae bacterium]|nr:hypothetical protein [Bryobacteraceae bacterium]